MIKGSIRPAQGGVSIRHLRGEPTNILFAWYENKAVGYIDFWVVLDELHLMGLYVHPHYRRMGIATQLFKEMVKVSPTYSAAYLEVRRSNAAAHALYRSLGLAMTGLRLRYYSDGEDAVTMNLSHVSPHQTPAL